MNATTRRHAPIALLILVSALALTGCASTTTTTVRAPSSAPPAAAPSASALAAAPSATPSPSEVACTSHSCITQDAEQSMVGTTAKDGSVITKADCFKSTVKANPGDTYTVSCDIAYTDGTVWNGLVTLLLASNQISWQPESEVS